MHNCSFEMGKTQSKEEVIIAQTASGDAKASITKSEIILMVICVLLLLVLSIKCMKKCRSEAKRLIRTEIVRNELGTSHPMMSATGV